MGGSVKKNPGAKTKLLYFQRQRSPKLVAFAKWEKIDEVNKMIDQGDSAPRIQKWVKENGFNISPPLVYDYCTIRKEQISKNIVKSDMVSLLTEDESDSVKRIPILAAPKDYTAVEYKEDKKRIRNELQLLDFIIQKGWDYLQTTNKPITPAVAMEAIALKNTLTGGAHMQFTEYGLTELREVENGKFKVVLKTVMEFVPENKRAKAIEAIAYAENEYYKYTPYYEDYLRLHGKTEKEIAEIIAEVKESRLINEIVTIN